MSMLMIGNLWHEVKVTRVSGPVVAGTTDINTTALDMASGPFDSIGWLVSFGAVTTGAVTSLKVQQGTDSTPTDAADLAGSSLVIADTSTDKDVPYGPLNQPAERWVRLVVKRGTQNAVINGVWAFQYNTRNSPVTQPSGMLATSYLNTPAEGTA